MALAARACNVGPVPLTSAESLEAVWTAWRQSAGDSGVWALGEYFPEKDSLLPTPYSLLPTRPSLLPSPSALLLTPYSLLPAPYFRRALESDGVCNQTAC